MTTNTNEELVSIFMSGHEFSENDVADCKRQLATNSDDVALNVSLLGYYFSRYYALDSARDVRREQVLWAITNIPECVLLGPRWDACLVMHFFDSNLYEETKELWSAQVRFHPDAEQILANAVNALAYADPQEAKTLIKASACPNKFKRKLRDHVRRIQRNFGELPLQFRK